MIIGVDEYDISERLRMRRAQLGLSLTDVARRAGTSPATLSRYEHGWNRFEVYTLRKLAAALDCDLRVDLCPRKRTAEPVPVDLSSVVNRLARLFWEHPLKTEDLDRHTAWVLERVLDYGDLSDIHALQSVMGRTRFLEAVARADRVSPRTRNFWSRMLEMEGIACTRAFSRDTAWNC
jgi:transcriptional regulator with XRE-family HTH domain